MPDPSPTTPYGPQTPQIRRFLQRLAALAPDEWARAAAAHEAQQRTPRFRGADRALSAAVAAAQREGERDAALGPLVRLVRRAPAPDGAPDAPDSDEAALDPVAEAALAAVLALLVRDLLSPTAFETLYAPFAALIPVESLGG